MDPDRPTPFTSGAAMLAGLPAEGIEALLAAAGLRSGSSLPVAAELRQLGGALGRPHPGAGAMARLHGQFSFFCGAPGSVPDSAARTSADIARTVESVAPWASGNYLNLCEDPVDPSTGYEPEVWARLCAIRTAVDPDGLFVANHAVPTRLAIAENLPRQR